jgi:hypothetical protein
MAERADGLLAPRRCQLLSALLGQVRLGLVTLGNPRRLRLGRGAYRTLAVGKHLTLLLAPELGALRLDRL